MRKRLIVLAVIANMLLMKDTLAAPTLPIYLDNSQISFDIDPLVKNGSALVPFDVLFEKLGIEADFDPRSQTITGKNNTLDIRLRIGSNIAIVNGQLKELNAAPVMENGYLLVPLRFVVEADGRSIGWDRTIGLISISSGDKDAISEASGISETK